MLRRWRELRRLSQLELAGLANVSARHLSFIETGRSTPGREVLLHLAEQLDVPLRERNQLLLSAGYAPLYGETEFNAPAMTSIRTAVRQLLVRHEPYPALLVDRNWQLLDANAGLELFVEGVADELLEPPVNVLRLALHPRGMAPRITNLGEWRGHLLSRLHSQVTLTVRPELTSLYDELVDYPCHQPERRIETTAVGDVVVPLRIRGSHGELAFFCTVATFGAALDVTLAELAIESFFPADAATTTALFHRAVANQS